jgi:DNA-directed RNA polymerase subunit E'/Rpb7
MDPLFERRELSKKVHIHSKFLQRNMEASILAQLKMSYEGMCSAEGYIERNSITLLDYSLGRTNYIRGGVDYDVRFQADVCLPHPGQRFKAVVKVRSKVGIHAETPPIKVLIPRDLHMGNEDFNKADLESEIEFEVVGSQFKQKDVEIIIVGKLLSLKEPEVVMTPEVQELAPAPAPVQDGEKQIVVTATTEPAKKTRKLKKGGGDEAVPIFKTLPPPPV